MCTCHLLQLQRRSSCRRVADDGRLPGIGMELVRLQFVVDQLSYCGLHIGTAQAGGEVRTGEACSRESFTSEKTR